MSHSPAVSGIEVIFAAIFVVSATAEPVTTVDEISSPMLPAVAAVAPATPYSCPRVEVRLPLASDVILPAP